MQGPGALPNRSVSPGRSQLAYFQVMRPKQWTKNLIAYAPLVFSANIHVPHLVECASLCVLAFCLMSSTTYIFNDLIDRNLDRLHSTKSKRPIAAGQISLAEALIIASILAISSLFLASAVRGALVVLLLAYLCLSLSYSLVLKHFAIVDVLAIATGFLLRATAGAVAIRVPISGWFLVCTGIGAVFLGLEKRRRELQTAQSTSVFHRKVLKTYSLELLNRLQSITLPTLLTSYCFYSFMSMHGQWMMLSVPFVLYGLMRYQQLSCSTEGATDTPENVLAHDRPIQISIVLWLMTSTLVVYEYIQNFVRLVMQAADSLVH